MIIMVLSAEDRAKAVVLVADRRGQQYVARLRAPIRGPKSSCTS